MTTAGIGATGRVGSEIIRGLPARGDAVTARSWPRQGRRAFGEPDGLHIRLRCAAITQDGGRGCRPRRQCRRNPTPFAVKCLRIDPLTDCGGAKVEHASDLNRREPARTASNCTAATCAESVLPGQRACQLAVPRLIGRVGWCRWECRGGGRAGLSVCSTWSSATPIANRARG